MAMIKKPTKGHLSKPSGALIKDGNGAAVVSFPASAGNETWERLIGGKIDSGLFDRGTYWLFAGYCGRKVDWCCVWTGKQDSPKSEWYDPWVENVEQAKKMGKRLVFVVNACHELGEGQKMEQKYLFEHGYSFKMAKLNKDGTQLEEF